MAKAPTEKELTSAAADQLALTKTELFKFLDKGIKMKMAMCWFGDSLVEVYDRKIKPKSLVKSMGDQVTAIVTKMIVEAKVDPKEKDKKVVATATKGAQAEADKLVDGKLAKEAKRIRGTVEYFIEKNPDGTPKDGAKPSYLYTVNKLEGEVEYVKALTLRLKPGAIPIVFQLGGENSGEEDEVELAATPAGPGERPAASATSAPTAGTDQPTSASTQQQTASPIAAVKASVATTYATIWTRTRTTVEEQLATFGKQIEDTYQGQPFAGQIAGAYKSKVLDPILQTLDLALATNMTAVAATEADPATQAKNIAEARETLKRYQAAMNSGPVADLFNELNEKNPWQPIKLGPAIAKFFGEVDVALAAKPSGAPAQPS